MKQPTPSRTGRGKRNGDEPPPREIEALGPEDFLAMEPLELVTDSLGLLRRGRNRDDPDVIAGVFQRLDALHQLMTSTADPALMTPIQKLSKDLREASRTLGKAEARFLVDAYYTMQENRIRSAHQVRTLAQPKDTAGTPANGADTEETEETKKTEAPEPHDVLVWLQGQEEHLEKQIRASLDVYSLSEDAGIWARSIKGIGPVIAAGFLANIDITRAPTVGHIWRFSGLDPTSVWNKGQKRPWNASLKRLCFLTGESFVKVSNRPDDVYGKLYKQRKEWETERNAQKQYADQARFSLENKNFGKDTEAYKWYSQGMLPPARIHLRAQRRAVKLFLAHLHEVMFWDKYKKLPAHPFVFDHMPGHVHRLEVPNLELLPGLAKAKARAQRGPRGR